MEHGAVLVLDELPSEKTSANSKPQGYYPKAFPIVLHEVCHRPKATFDGVVLLCRD